MASGERKMKLILILIVTVVLNGCMYPIAVIDRAYQEATYDAKIAKRKARNEKLRAEIEERKAREEQLKEDKNGK